MKGSVGRQSRGLVMLSELVDVSKYKYRARGVLVGEQTVDGSVGKIAIADTLV